MSEGWDGLPTELLLMIMSYLEAKELARLGNVNYHWKRVGEDDSLWKYLFFKDFTRNSQTYRKVCERWIDEYKLLKFEPPITLTESLRDCPDGLSHVAFSDDGQLFCTTANDASFKIWTATSPVYLLDERYMDDALGWERALSSQFSADNKRLLVAGVKFGGVGEIAVYSVDEDSSSIHYLCRVLNNPPEVGACWYNSSYIFSGDIYFFNRNSVVGTSVSQIWICSSLSPDAVGNESVMSPVFRILNRGGSYCQMIKLGRFVPSRLRGVVVLAEEAAIEHKTLTSKANELVSDELSGNERRNEMKKRIEEISPDWETECSSCKNWHLINEDGNIGDSSRVTYAACCPCFCHENDHRLLIYATGDNEFSPPHRIAFKIVDGNMIAEKIYPETESWPKREERSSGRRHRRQEFEEAQLSAIMSMVDFPDHIIDMKAYIMGMTLSLDQKYLYVNVTHDNYGGSSQFAYLAEICVINLSTMIIEKSYIGHFATCVERFGCSVGGHYVASASVDGGRIWSREYHCVIGELPHAGGAAAVALNPVDGTMAVSVGKTDGKIKIWRSKKFLHRYTVPNDFM
ncbi:unnamed protein product [Cercopithifilaria johnstoni]|uniref:F-box domain-containing protein n=1 Tax=Cercopithifilaria johnstoni TaxID=2874296 RepID=A0A8J2LRL9_9BILA|nr:unnamed protein product [Cercopithifilaria johnstoni]